MVKVLDFGLVKAVNAEAGHRTGANMMVGTPHFMAPEAITKPDSVDARSDLYSLGAVGYWLLTGKCLFDTDDVEQLLSKQVNELPLPPSERLGRPCSADLEAIIMQCLAKSPAQRPPGADALEAALAHCMSAGTWTLENAEKWWRVNSVSTEIPTEVTMPEKTLVIAPRT